MPRRAYATVSAISSSIEARYGIKVIAIHDQAGIQIGGYSGNTYVLLLLPEDEPLLNESAMLIQAELNKPELSFGIMVHTLTCYKELFDCWTERGGKASYGLTSFVPLLWQTVIYGLPTMENLREAVEERFDKGAIETFRAERKRWRHRVWWRSRKEHAKYVERMENCRTVLNDVERADLERFFARVKESYEDGVRYVVGIDGSGRPLAMAAKWYLNELGRQDVFLGFIDTHQLRNQYFGREDDQKPQMLDRFLSALETDDPEVFRWLCDCHKSLILVEDQIGYGRATQALSAFLEHLTGSFEGKMFVLSTWMEDNPPPSWWWNKNLQGIVRVPEGTIGMTSQLAPSQKSLEFYRRLEEFSRELAREHKQ